ncbi:MAG: cytochrome c oxidase subunit II [Propionibacteriales bacterium]|nr:cytochrome c oxidase subunit II [Propionibacteriales bacterium]
MAASALGLLVLLLLTGCSEETTDQWKRLGLPEQASDRTPYIHDLWIGAWIAAFIIGGFTWALIGWVSVRYRRRSSDDLPTQVRYNAPIEALYTIAPVIVVAVLFFFTVEKQEKVLDQVANPDHQLVVTAQRWSWTFNYIEESGAGGENVYDTGTSAAEPDLWLVEDETVSFDLHSPDVIHSFWVPSFYFKLDVIPGRDNSFSLTPTKAGTFQGRCAELCGYQHSRMLFKVRVVSREDFDQHMAELVDLDQVGTLRGAKGSTTVAGLDEGNDGEGQ